MAILVLFTFRKVTFCTILRVIQQSHCTMDPQSRNTASAYINNLLLSRGLLRNGTPITFANPEKTEGGVDATMSQVMNLVHDLILRRDVSDLLYRHLHSHVLKV